MSFLRWLSADESVGVAHDARWAWGTILLSALLAIGYCVIAVNWYFQSKLARKSESKAALARLRGLFISCAVCGVLFFAIDTPWVVWRLYDAILLFLVFRTWSFILKTRGLSLVDERLAQMNALEETASRYREIAELLPHIVWTATADGRVDFSNQRWKQYIGDSRTWLEALHPEEQGAALAAWNQAVSTRQPFNLEARLGAAGTFRTFVVKATPIVHGGALKWLGACADIEDQKLLAAQKDLQARQKSFFLNALSHDLRAPLHCILLNAHLLKLSVQDKTDLESVEMIRENAVSAGDLVSKLLDFAKVGAQDRNQLESVSVVDALHQVERRFLPIAEQKGLYLKLHSQSDARLLTDRQKLERLVSNLVDNAIKYTARGGVKVELAGSDAALSIRISDTGIGIPQTNVPYLFDEFYQVNNYERDRSKGFGMGLAICKSLAHHIGADVRLASTGPEGSCFEVVMQGVGADRGGRLGGAKSDHAPARETGLCRL